MEEYVLGFAFSEDQKQLALICKDRPEWQKGFWNGIGGKVEEEELPSEAMVREFEEETGVRIEEWTPFASLTGPGFHVACYRCFDDRVLKARTAETERVLLWDVPGLSINEAFKPLPNLRWLIPLALDNRSGKSPEDVVAFYT
jgi:8-oxo-dGTP diphosphatase